MERATNRMTLTEMSPNSPFVINKNAFVKVMKMLKGRDGNVLSYMLLNAMVYNKHTLMYIGRKTDICKGASLSRPTVTQCMKRLIENHVIYQEDENMWTINPTIIFYHEGAKRIQSGEPIT